MLMWGLCEALRLVANHEGPTYWHVIMRIASPLHSITMKAPMSHLLRASLCDTLLVLMELKSQPTEHLCLSYFFLFSSWLAIRRIYSCCDNNQSQRRCQWPQVPLRQKRGKVTSYIPVRSVTEER